MSIKKLRDVGRSELQKRAKAIRNPFDRDSTSNQQEGASDGIQGVRNIEPQRAYLWEVNFPNPFTPDGDNTSLYAQQTAIPAAIVENLKRYYAGVEYSYPSRDMSPRIFRVTFYDNDELINYRFFEAWRQATSNTREQYKTAPAVHNRDIELKLLDTTNSSNVATFLMYNCRPTEISEATLAYDSSSLLTFDVLFYFTHKDLI